MKITKQQLKQIIKEEIEKVLSERKVPQKCEKLFDRWMDAGKSGRGREDLDPDEAHADYMKCEESYYTEQEASGISQQLRST